MRKSKVGFMLVFVLAIVMLIGTFPIHVLAAEYVGPSDTISAEPLPMEIHADLPRLIFKPEDFTQEILNGNTIPFTFTFSKPNNINYTGKEDYKIRIQIDERIAQHITSMKSEVERPHNDSNAPIRDRNLLRMPNGLGGWRNIWEINYSEPYGGLIIGKGDNTNVLNGLITLDETVGEILERYPNYLSDPIIYSTYIADTNLNVIYNNTSTSGGIGDGAIDLPENTDISNQGAEHFIGSGLEAYFDKTLGENGAFIVEQYWVPSLNFDYEKQGDNIVMKRLWTYRFKPDVILSPLIDKIEMYRIGNDKNPQENYRNITLVASTNGEGIIYDGTTGWGRSPDISRNKTTVLDMLSPNGAISTRFIYYLNKDLTTVYSQLLNDGLQGFNFKGYLADNEGNMIPTSYATGYFYIADTDGDGVPDDVEVTDPLVGKPRLLDIYDSENTARGIIYMDKMASTQKAHLELNEQIISDIIEINPIYGGYGQGSDVPINFNLLSTFTSLSKEEKIGSKIKMVVTPAIYVEGLEANTTTNIVKEAPIVYNPYRIPVGFQPTEVDAKDVVINSDIFPEGTIYNWTYLPGIDATSGATPRMVNSSETYYVTIEVLIPDSSDPTYIHKLVPRGILEVYFEIEINAEDEPAENEMRITFSRGEHGNLRLVSITTQRVFTTDDENTALTLDVLKDISWSKISNFIPEIVSHLGWTSMGWKPILPSTDTVRTFEEVLSDTFAAGGPYTFTAQYEANENIIKIDDPESAITSGFTRIIFSGGDLSKLREVGAMEGTSHDLIIFDVLKGKVTWNQLLSFVPEIIVNEPEKYEVKGDKNHPDSWSPKLWENSSDEIIPSEANSYTFVAQVTEKDKEPPILSYSKDLPYRVMNNATMDPLIISSKDNIDLKPMVEVYGASKHGIEFTNLYSGDSNYALIGTPTIVPNEWNDTNGYEKEKTITFNVSTWDSAGNYSEPEEIKVIVLRETSSKVLGVITYSEFEKMIKLNVVAPYNETGSVRVLDSDGKELIASQASSPTSRTIDISSLKDGQKFVLEFTEDGKLPSLSDTYTIKYPVPEQLGLRFSTETTDGSVITITNSIASDKEIKVKIGDVEYLMTRDAENNPVMHPNDFTVEREFGTSILYLTPVSPLTKLDLDGKTVTVQAINYYDVGGAETSGTINFEFSSKPVISSPIITEDKEIKVTIPENTDKPIVTIIFPNKDETGNPVEVLGTLQADGSYIALVPENANMSLGQIINAKLKEENKLETYADSITVIEGANVEIKYIATIGGTVSKATESVAPTTGIAQGSTATASSGYTFTGWSKGTNTTIISTEATYVPEKVNGLNVAETYTANFAPLSNVTISYEAGEGGSVNPSAESLNPETGEAKGSTASPSPGYKFVNWTDSNDVQVSSNATFIPQKNESSGVYEAQNYTANFELENIIDGNIDVNAPDHILVTFAAGDGVTLNETKTYKVKLETTLPETYFPSYTVETGYENATWLPTGRVITETNKSFTVSATQTPFNLDTVKSIEIVTQPKLSYKESESLDLSDLVVKLTDGNNRTKEYNFEEFGDIISTNPVNGTKLNMENNNNPISISVKGISINTNNLNIVAMEKTTEPTINKVTAGDTVITGTSEPNAEITLTIGAIVEKIKANDQGIWTYSTENLATGQTITAKAQVLGKSISDEAFATVVAKEDVIITYVARTGGTVSPTTETINPDATSSTGSIATPNDGYDFVNWTDSSATEVSTSLSFKPERPTTGYTDAKYTANFRPHIYEDINDVTIPENYVTVTFTAGAGIAIENNKTYRVKPGIILADSYFPSVTLQDGYKDYAWTPAERTINENTIFTANATLVEFDKDNIVNLQVVTQPTNLNYKDGDILNLTGLSVKLTDKNNLEKIVNLSEFTDYNLSTNPLDETLLSIEDNGKVIKIILDELVAETLPINVTKSEIIDNTSATPTAYQPIEGDIKISGTGVRGATIFIQTPNGETITTTVDENGKWTIDLDAPLILSEKIIVKSQEENKDLSEEVTVEVMKKKEEDIPTQPKPPTPPLPPVEPVEPKPIPDFPIDRNYLDILFESSPKSIPTIKTPVVNMITENHSSYINGYSDGSFKGDRSITRSEVAILISKLKGFNTLDNSKPNFSDMDLNYWANGAINAMLKEGLMKGYPDGTFRPNSSITRGEIAQILISMDNKNSGINPFKDTRDHWAEDAITQGYLNDRIKGYEDGTFRPDNPITRAEVVTMMNRMFNRKTNNSSIENIFIQSPFNDIDNSHWAYYEILEGAINHTSQRENLDEYEIWQTVNN